MIVTKGALARRLLEWMYLASMVLPVPDSPVIKTVESKFEMRRIVSRMLLILLSERIMPSGDSLLSSGWRGSVGDARGAISSKKSRLPRHSSRW